MKDEEDLEELEKLVETLRKIERGDCTRCPLYYDNHHIIADECDSFVMDIFNTMYTSVELHCRKVKDRKIDEVTRYMLERSLKGE